MKRWWPHEIWRGLLRIRSATVTENAGSPDAAEELRYEPRPWQFPFWIWSREPESLRQQTLAAMERVMRSGQFILGPEVAAFEAECAVYLGVKHAIGVSSGTDALLLAMMALGIGAGDEVVCPSFTFFATAGAVARLGARPVFVDSHPRCFNASDFRGAVTSRTKALMPVHLFGQSIEMDPILRLAQETSLPIIEDAAQAIGATYRGKKVGSFGAFGCFSFFPSKNLGAYGDAGLVTTNDDALAEKARVLRMHGMSPKYYHAEVGGNFRLDALQAAVLRVRLAHLDAWTKARQKNAELYRARLLASGLAAEGTGVCASTCPRATDRAPSLAEAPLILPSRCQPEHIFNQFVVRIPRGRDAVQSALKAQGIASEIYYPVPLHLQQCFATLGYLPGVLPNAERLAAEVLALPIFPDLQPEEINLVCDALVTALGHGTR